MPYNTVLIETADKEPKSILFIGSTGYIGSAVLDKILTLVPSWPITALMRDEAKLEKIQGYKENLKGVKGSLDDFELLEKLASEHHITIDTADADNVEATEALLKGMAKRKAKTGHRPIYIHTSGTGILADDAAGQWPTEKIYTDLGSNPTGDPPLLSIDSLPDTAPHRPVDLLILDADARADIRGFIILPSTIYGINKSPLVTRGVGNDQSIQMPTLIKASIDRGRAGMVGNGQNIWPNVHINDVADLYAAVFKYSVSGKKGNHGRQGYYFGESGEHTLWLAGQKIGLSMYKAGMTEETEPSTFTKEEIDKYFGGSNYLGSNSRCRGDRSRTIGWRPRYDDQDFQDSFDEEFQVTLQKRGPDGKFDFGGKL